MKKLVASLAIGALVALSTSAVAQSKKEDKPVAQTLPNGASSLSETYGLWTVSCMLQDGVKACGMGRQEVNAQNQPVVTMNISQAADGSANGILVVPFGLLVSKPIKLQIDDTKSMIETQVRTCVAQGCIVPVAFDKTALTALRSGKQLKMEATSAANGEPKVDNLFVQLDGFSSAYDRLSALKK